MSGNVSMRLCGVNIPHENWIDEKTAANRIHKLATGAETNGLLGYDNLDIAATLDSTLRDAVGIQEAVQQRTFVDLTGQPLDASTVEQELGILSGDLAKIADIAKKALATQEGQARWPNSTPNVHGHVISIEGTIMCLDAMSQTFKNLPATIKEEEAIQRL